MAKEKKEKPVPEIPKKHSYFPKFLFVFGVLLVVVAIAHYFKWLIVPELLLDILLLLAGLKIIKIGLETGFYKKRKETLKKYL
jgi:hypothetical protein